MGNYKYTWTQIEELGIKWKLIAEEHNGMSRVIKVQSFANTSDPFLRKFELKIPFKESEILFITTEHKPLKISYIFKDNLNVEFLLYPEDFTDKISKFFGLKELEIGNNEFDNRFIIKCKEKELINQIFSKEIRKYFINSQISNFKLFTEKEISVLELNILINELNKEQMNQVLNVMKNIIEIISCYDNP